MLVELILLLLTFALCHTKASIVPQTTSLNSTFKGSPTGPAATTGCPISCTRRAVSISSLLWSSVSITATITAETVLLVVNPLKNSTETNTITNAEIDLKSYTSVTDLNSAGTRTTSVVLTSSGTITTQTIAYPTTWHQDYPSVYTLCGTLPTTVSGTSTCIKNPCKEAVVGNNSAMFDGAPTFTFPSHPSVPWPSPTIGNLGLDPRGLTYEPVWDFEGDYKPQIEPLIPNLGLWNCHGQLLEQPATVKETALYVTATSTAVQSGEYATSIVPIYSGTRLPIGAAGAVRKSTASSQDSAPKPSEAPTSKLESLGSELTSSHHDSARTSSSVKIPLTESIVNVGPISTTAVNGAANALVNIWSPAFSATPSQPITAPVFGENRPATSTTSSSTPSSGKLAADFSVDLRTSIAANSQDHTFQQTVATSFGTVADPSSTSFPKSDTTVYGSREVQNMNGLSPAIQISTTTPIALVIGSLTASTDSDKRLILGSQTLTPDLPILLGSGNSATSVLLHTRSSDIILVVGSSTSTLIGAPSAAINPQPFRIGNQVVTVNSQDQYIVGSQTLVGGAAITISGTPISLAPGATQVVVGSSTQALGGHIDGGYGPGPSANTSGVLEFTGNAERRSSVAWGTLALEMGALLLMMWV